MLSLRSRRQTKLSAVERNELIILVIEAMPGQRNICMRYHHAIKLRIIEPRLVPAIHDLRAVTPAPIHREHHPALRTRTLFLGKCLAANSRSCKKRTARLNKIASVHIRPYDETVFNFQPQKQYLIESTLL